MSSIYGSGYVADIGKAYQATPHGTLLEQIMDSRVPKTEREHAAAREIERLRAALAAQPVEPVAYVRQSTYDASIMFDKVAICGWHNFDKKLDELKADAWVIKGRADIVPLYAAPPAPTAVPLTDEWIAAFSMDIDGLNFAQVEKLVRHVERAQGIAAAGDKP